MGSNPTSVNRKIGRVVKYNRCESGAQETAVCLSRGVRIPPSSQKIFKIMAKIELTVAVNKTFEFDIEDIKEYYPSILTEMKKRGMNPENLNEMSDFIFEECVSFVLDRENPLLRGEEIDEHWTTL